MECRGAAIPHPKVLRARLGCGVRGSGRAAGPAPRPRSGWLRPAPAGPGPARPPHSARTGPGRCRRHPGPARRHRPPATVGPVGQQRRLAEPGRRAHTSTRPRPRPSPSASTRRGRGTKPGCGRGTCSLVISRTSGPDMAIPADAAPTGQPSVTDRPGQPGQRASAPFGRARFIRRPQFRGCCHERFQLTQAHIVTVPPTCLRPGKCGGARSQDIRFLTSRSVSPPQHRTDVGWLVTGTRVSRADPQARGPQTRGNQGADIAV